MARRTREENAALYGMDKVTKRRTGETDEKYYKRLAAAADRRLERIEAEMFNNNIFEALTKNSAYGSALEDIRAFTGDESASRFRRAFVKNEDGSLNKKNLHARLNAVKKFLESPTSTRAGIKKVSKVRTNTLNERYGTNLTPTQANNIFTSAWYQSKTRSDSFASKTVIQAIGEMQKLPKGTDLQALADSNQTVSNNEVLDAVAKELIKEGFTLESLNSK